MRIRAALYFTLTTVVAFLAGCAPNGHRSYSRPDIQGSLLVATVAVRGAEVLIGTSPLVGQPCNDAVAVGVTGQHGEFTVAGLDKVDLLDSLLDPPEVARQLTNVCFRRAGEPVVFGGRFVTPTDKPSQLAIVCDSAMPAQRSPLGEPQICH